MKRLIKIVKIAGIMLAGILVIAALFITFYKPFGKKPWEADRESYVGRTDAYYDGTFHGNPEISVMSNGKSDFSGDEERVPKGEIPVVSLDSIPSAGEDELKWTLR